VNRSEQRWRSASILERVRLVLTRPDGLTAIEYALIGHRDRGADARDSGLPSTGPLCGLCSFPEVYERLRGEIAPPARGAVYLVGAGAFGQVYCDWIRARGSIGIDIGSVFDGWAGVRVRERLALRKEQFALERYREPLGRDARIAGLRDFMRRKALC